MLRNDTKRKYIFVLSKINPERQRLKFESLLFKLLIDGSRQESFRTWLRGAGIKEGLDATWHELTGPRRKPGQRGPGRLWKGPARKVLHHRRKDSRHNSLRDTQKHVAGANNHTANALIYAAQIQIEVNIAFMHDNMCEASMQQLQS